MAKSLNLSKSGIAGLVRLVADAAPTTTLAELLSDSLLGAAVRVLTLGELLGAAGEAVAPKGARKKPGPKKGRGKKAAKAGKAVAAKAVAAAPAKAAVPAKAGGRPAKNAAVRTEEGRKAYDAAVLAGIAAAKKPVGASDVRKSAGGTSLQFRAAVERLLAAKKIKRTGKAKGTRYTAA